MPTDPRHRHHKAHDSQDDDDAQWIDGEGDPRRVMRIWVFVFLGVILLLAGLCVIAVHRHHEKIEGGDGGRRQKCFVAPAIRGDRRRDKDTLTVANFNAEWLFLEGGSGSIECPSESCPWAVQPQCMSSTDVSRTLLKRVIIWRGCPRSLQSWTLTLSI
jgi:hypothetical protein